MSTVPVDQDYEDDDEDEDEDPMFCLSVDLGSYKITSGFAGDSVPRSVLSTNIGHSLTNDEVYYGDMVLNERRQFQYSNKHISDQCVDTDQLCLKPTVEYVFEDHDALVHGYVRSHSSRQIPAEIVELMLQNLPKGLLMDWQQLEILWQYVLEHELRVPSQEYSVILSEPSLVPKHCRERTAEILLEHFECPALKLCNSAVLAFTAAGGGEPAVICDIGHYKCDITPVYEGYALQSAVCRLEIGGKDVTEYLAKLLAAKFHESFAMDIAYDIKHHYGSNYTYTLPDGRILNVENEVRQMSDILFTPNLCAMKPKGIVSLIEESVNRCDQDLQPSLRSRVVLSGGSSLLGHIDERIEREMFKDIPYLLRVRSPPERKYTAWIGGSIIGGMPSTYDGIASWLTKQDLAEYGATIIHRKCF